MAYSNNKGKGMTKAQKIIVLAAAVLIIVVVLFPPYKECGFNDKGEWTGKCYINWEFNRDLRAWISDIKEIIFESSMSFRLITGPTPPPLMGQLWLAEIIGILVLAGAGLLITNKAKQ
jgi:hypothetical protein